MSRAVLLGLAAAGLFIAALDASHGRSVPLGPETGRAPFDRIRSAYQVLKDDVVTRRQVARDNLTNNIRILLIVLTTGFVCHQ